MAKGFAPYLLKHIATIAGFNTPQMKMEVPGFLNLLMSQSNVKALELGTAAGHKKTMRVKAKQRATKGMTDTSKSCDNVLVPAWQESTVELSVTRQIAIHIEDETIAQYEEDASRTVSLGQPATPMMNEFLENILSHTSAIMEAVNDDLLTVASAAVGTNRATGSATSQALNINKDNTINPLDNGLTKLLSDYKINGGKGRPQIIGAGLFLEFMIQKANNAVGISQSGLDVMRLANFDFYFDMEMEVAFGTNQIMVYEPNAVGLVEYMEYTGFKAGDKGVSTFGVIVLPALVNGEIKPVKFDFQLKYNDCVTTFTDAYYGTELTLEKGYNLIISKQCGLWTIPADSYRATDVLSGNRGSYRYTISNDCEACA
jgi:hypothetical protein